MNGHPTRYRRIVLAAALLLLTTGCTAIDREADVAAMDDSTAEQIVVRYADEALRLSGRGEFSQQTRSSGPCVGRQGETAEDIYTMQGAYQLLVPGPEQQMVIDKIRAGWHDLGYTIVTERTFGPDLGGQVHANNPADDTSLILGTGEIPALSLLIHTGCYRRTSG